MEHLKDHIFIKHVNGLGAIKTMALFGASAVFCDNAMFCLLVEEDIYIAGGGHLDNELIALGCKRYQQIKKQTISMINYYEISALFLSDALKLEPLIQASIELAKQRKNNKLATRLRDLPNMHFTIERMVKKAGIENVDTFLAIGPEQAFKMVQNHYGQTLKLDLLWKFAGATEGYHWTQIEESRKQQLLSRLS